MDNAPLRRVITKTPPPKELGEGGAAARSRPKLA